MSRIKVAVAGARGYTGQECVRILANHPLVTLVSLQSEGAPGSNTHEIFPFMKGKIPDCFSSMPDRSEDVLFLCLPHGRASDFLIKYQPENGVKIIDLSTDHRPPCNSGFTYGLSDVWPKEIAMADRVANPGCFATAIQLALLPLAGMDEDSGAVHCSALTGASGAGIALKASTGFCQRQNNLSVYKAFEHQHLAEINATLNTFSQKRWKREIIMIPFRAPVSRGIYASLTLPVTNSGSKIRQVYEEFYQDRPFVWLMDREPELREVAGTNNCLLFMRVYRGCLHLVVAIDNLLKGAAGQAVQNMNLMLDFPQETGLCFHPLPG